MIVEITDHPYTRCDVPGWVRCTHVEVRSGVGRPCDRPEDEHAPAEDTEAGA